MTADSAKPVRHCKDCDLNLGNRCGVFECPADKWKKRTCEGLNNPVFVELYERTQNPEGAYARKQARVEKAKLADTEDHHDGVHPPCTP